MHTFPKLAFSISMIAFSSAAFAGHTHGASETKNGLTVGGQIDFQAAYLSEDANSTKRNTTFANDTEVHFTYRNVTENGLTYGAVIELETDVTEDAREEGLNADKTYLFAEHALGRAELGAVDDAGHRLGVDASTFARATGGIHGDWFLYSTFPSSSTASAHSGHGSFIHSPTLPAHHEHGTSEDATKISYYSPRIGGFQIGFSYAPDTGDAGQQFSGKTGHRAYNDVLNGGINYTGNYQDIKYALSLTGETGRSELPGHENLGAYALGTVVEWKGLSVGGSYGNWNQSLTHTTANNPIGQYYTAGIGYDIGQGGVSLGWFESSYQHNTVSLVSLGADYNIIAGLTPYAEVNFVSLDATSASIADNDAIVVLMGTVLNF